MYICKHFAIHELVPPEVYKARGEKAWELLDERLLRQLDLLRNGFGPMTVNNYHWGGERQYSGLRMPGDPFYSPYSQHSFGRAADCLFRDANVAMVREIILRDINDPLFKYINSIELDVSWLHFDVRNCERIKTYRP